ncbi:hypothetical protein U750_05085 [Streptococcus pseudopneumoniae G42]|jgi:hypothetical protein|nr:hypothetical protein U752_07920 [Streptococcus pseudopneumoniae 1321]ETE07582.1 hypothetical protein U750_05085 [Streptococcus pseudopneumoniae G42]
MKKLKKYLPFFFCLLYLIHGILDLSTLNILGAIFKIIISTLGIIVTYPFYKEGNE